MAPQSPSMPVIFKSLIRFKVLMLNLLRVQVVRDLHSSMLPILMSFAHEGTRRKAVLGGEDPYQQAFAPVR